jgi:hypothetical protein
MLGGKRKRITKKVTNHLDKTYIDTIIGSRTMSQAPWKLKESNGSEGGIIGVKSLRKNHRKEPLQWEYTRKRRKRKQEMWLSWMWNAYVAWRPKG